MKTPDIEAIRAFLLVADLKSFTRAAEVAGTTQAAISLKIKRLEESLGRALLERTPRRVTLSAQGSVFIASARRLLQSYDDTLRCFDAPRRTLRIGVSHHILGADLSHWLQRLAQADPEVIVAFSLGTSRQMLESYEEGALDIALILRHDNRRQDGEVIGSERFGWMAAESFELDDGAPLPLAIQPAPAACAAWSAARCRGRTATGAKPSSAREFWPSVQRCRPVSALAPWSSAWRRRAASMCASASACLSCHPATWCSIAPIATPRHAR